MKRIHWPYIGYRFLECIPATVVWGTLIAVIVLSFVQPLVMIMVAVAFDLYWLLRVWYFIIYLTYSWNQYRKQRTIRWMHRVRTLPQWEQYHHIVFLPMVDESIAVLRHTFHGLLQSTYPSQRLLIVLAGEERAADHFREVSGALVQEFRSQFFDIVCTLHPHDMPGDVASKGANLHWAGQRVKEYVDEQGWSYDQCIVSTFDVDTVVDPEYFACLTVMYLTHPRPTRSSYQPLALYNNNIWDSPSFTRVVAHSTTFWLMAELARPKPLWTFSSHSMSFRALVDVGFWQRDIVTEDSRIFLQCFIHYDGDYEVTPMYIPVSMDTAYAGKLWLTIKNLYKQQRRWAWGIEHFPYMVWHFWGSKLPRRKWHLVFNLTEGMYSWSTAPLLILLLGYIPLWAAGDVEKATVIAQYAPVVLEWLMRIAMVGIFVSAVLNVFLLPTTIPGNRWLKLLVIVLQWLLLPVTLIIFGSFPAIDAQTRLALGKQLGFYTTKKVRSKNAEHAPASVPTR